MAGQEQLCVTLDVPVREKAPYDATGDGVIYLPEKVPYPTIIMRPGYFFMLFPRDIHMPGIAMDNQPEPITKIVIKIAMELFK